MSLFVACDLIIEAKELSLPAFAEKRREKSFFVANLVIAFDGKPLGFGAFRRACGDQPCSPAKSTDEGRGGGAKCPKARRFPSRLLQDRDSQGLILLPHALIYEPHCLMRYPQTLIVTFHVLILLPHVLICFIHDLILR